MKTIKAEISLQRTNQIARNTIDFKMKTIVWLSVDNLIVANTKTAIFVLLLIDIIQMNWTQFYNSLSPLKKCFDGVRIGEVIICECTNVSVVTFNTRISRYLFRLIFRFDKMYLYMTLHPMKNHSYKRSKTTHWYWHRFLVYRGSCEFQEDIHLYLKRNIYTIP